MLGQDQDKQSALSTTMKKLWQDPEYRARQSEARKKRWQDPEYRAKMIAMVSTAIKKRWQDPEYRAKQIATVSTAIKKRWQDPEYRAKQSAAVSTAMKKRWQDPEYRVRQSALQCALSTAKKLQNILGDYVVHIEHGIARFGGVTTFSVNGSKQRYLVLVYADGKLYVPTDQIRRVRRYTGGDQPRLSRLDAKPLELRQYIYQLYRRQEVIGEG